MATNPSDAHTQATNYHFAEVPKVSFEFDTLKLVIRKQKNDVTIEANGPNGEQVESTTVMPEKFLDPSVFPSPYELGQALFPGPILDLQKSLYKNAISKGKGLRLLLDFRGEANCYVYLRWEELAIEGLAVASDPRLAIARTAISSQPALPFEATEAPYRILLILSWPEKLPQGHEMQNFQQSVEEDYVGIEAGLKPLIDKGLIELVTLKGKDATLENLRAKLKEEDYPALFYAGPSSFGNLCDGSHLDQKKLQHGYLYFDNGNGIAQAVSGQVLSEVLQDSPVRLVFLNACNTAYGRPDQHESEGIAEALMDAGIPAVVGYEVQVYDKFSSAFAAAFYKGLTQLNSLDLAMYAGQKAMADLGAGINDHFKANWSDPWLFTRLKDGEKVFSGDIGGKISAFVNEKGELEFVEQKRDESDLDIFNRQLKSLNSLLQQVHDLEARTKAQNQVLKATRKLKQDPDGAINQLSDTTMGIVAAIKKQQTEKKLEKIAFEKQQKEEGDAWDKEIEEQEKERKRTLRKQLERTIVLSMALLMITIVGVLAYYMDENTEIRVLGLPLPVVLWSFIGGVGATLYAFVGTQKYAQTEPLRLDWLIGRPVVGVIMGSVVYLAIATSVGAIGGVDVNPTDSKPYLLWALAFLGGFSDKFALLLFDSLVGKYSTGANAVEEGQPKPPPPPKKEKPPVKKDPDPQTEQPVIAAQEGDPPIATNGEATDGHPAS